MESQNKFLLGGLLILVSLGVILFFSQGDQDTQVLGSQELEKLTVGIQTSPAMALVMVAEEKEFDKLIIEVNDIEDRITSRKRSDKNTIRVVDITTISICIQLL